MSDLSLSLVRSMLQEWTSPNIINDYEGLWLLECDWWLNVGNSTMLNHCRKKNFAEN
jgi:hypothetical protein